MRIILAISAFFLFSCQPEFDFKAYLEEAVPPEYEVSHNQAANLNITFAGDIMAHDMNFRMKDYNLIYEGIKDVLMSDDISFGNLEFPIDETRPYQSYPRFNVRRPYVEAAIKAGFDVFAMANNHTCDQDVEGIYETLKSMDHFRDNMNIHYNGIHIEPEKVFEPTVFFVNGIEIGFLSVAGFTNRGDGMEHMAHVYLPKKKNHDGLVERVKAVADNYDLFILGIHYGTEHERDLEYPMTDLYSRFIDVGVDIVWGHHPHVLQPAYMPIGPDGFRKLIIHSNGNFVSAMHSMVHANNPTHFKAFTGDSALYQVNVVMRGDDVEVTAAEPLIISNYKDPDNGVLVARLDELANSDLKGQWQAYFQKRVELMEGEAPVFMEHKNLMP